MELPKSWYDTIPSSRHRMSNTPQNGLFVWVGWERGWCWSWEGRDGVHPVRRSSDVGNRIIHRIHRIRLIYHLVSFQIVDFIPLNPRIKLEKKWEEGLQYSLSFYCLKMKDWLMLGPPCYFKNFINRLSMLWFEIWKLRPFVFSKDHFFVTEEVLIIHSSTTHTSHGGLARPRKQWKKFPFESPFPKGSLQSDIVFVVERETCDGDDEGWGTDRSMLLSE